ncbi:ABC transporter family protein [Besnoitia besnoiti]|uniref:ABC transporter family protein n=1 Tax=Besnoitia besnoiti TaxID=94643 RepID=A0A2A9MEE8_BESBE|nr:ABC transporter family protein [Besnoitia besnoiti]PFH35574.1 ABC transporter family protein [Besnoitia besnoiti]
MQPPHRVAFFPFSLLRGKRRPSLPPRCVQTWELGFSRGSAAGLTLKAPSPTSRVAPFRYSAVLSGSLTYRPLLLSVSPRWRVGFAGRAPPPAGAGAFSTPTEPLAWAGATGAAQDLHPLLVPAALPFSTSTYSSSCAARPSSGSPLAPSPTSAAHASTFGAAPSPPPLSAVPHTVDCRVCPVARAPKSPSSLHLLRSLLPFLWPASLSHRLRVLGAVASLVAAKFMTTQAPLLLANMVDCFQALPAAADLASHPPPEDGGAAAAEADGALNLLEQTARVAALPLGIVCGFPLARIAASGFNELRSLLFARVSQSASSEFACHAFLHLHSLAFFHDKKAGELSVLISRGIKSITSLLNVLLFQLFPTALEFLLVLYLLAAKVAGPVALITLATMAAYVAFTTAVTSRRTKIRKAMNRAEQQSAGLLVDSLANAEAVRFFTAEKQELKRFATVQRHYAVKNVAVNESLALLNFGQQLIFNCGVLGALLFTASQVAAGALPVGHLVLVSNMLLQLAIPLNFVGTIYRETSLNLIDLEKLYELLNMQPPIQNPPNAKAFVLKRGEIEFDRVSFAYPPVLRTSKAEAAAEDRRTDAPEARRKGSALLLEDVSLTVRPGEKVAIVGSSGAGKSTLIKLLYRMYDPKHGTVRIDGQDVKELDLTSFRQHIGVVPQDMVLFNDTVEFNIKYGCPSATDEQVKAAAQQAEIHDMIMGMPDGYKTVVGERGLKLSGGERQRIGIARCLLRNPAVAIFDEATSALDSHTEQKILKAFRAMSRGRTTLVIAHRLSTISDADKIVYLKDGKVAELGTHDELLRRPGGLYRALWESQQHQDAARKDSEDFGEL